MVRRLFILLAGILFLGGCAAQRGPLLRLYNLKEGRVLRVNVTDRLGNHGILSATLPDGERLSGEYFISPPKKEPRLKMPRPGDLVPFASGTADSAAAGTSVEKETAESPFFWTDLYGFGPASDARPVGSAILTGNRGSVFEIVFYHYSASPFFADGVGRDNHGRFYRVYFGKNP